MARELREPYRILARNREDARTFTNVRFVDGVPVVDLTAIEALLLAPLVEPLEPRAAAPVRRARR